MELDDLDKLIIIFHGVDNRPFLSKFKFQKAIFLSVLAFSEGRRDALEKLDSISFYPHKYGPYSEYVEEKRMSLEREGILKKIDDGKDTLTSEGLEIYETITDRMEKLKVFIIRNIKNMVNVPIKDRVLALFVYDIAERYGFIINSEILEDLEKNRIKYSIILYKNGIVSRERASELARMNLFDFSSLLMKVKSL